MNPSVTTQVKSIHAGDSPAIHTAHPPMVLTYQVPRALAAKAKAPLTNSERAEVMTPVLEKILALPVQHHWGINE